MIARAVVSAATLCASAALVLASTGAALSGYAEGAPPGFSGGFGEQSCHACHFHAELNSGPGRVTLTGVPEQFVAGQRYPLTITLAHPDMKRGGFQLTSRFEGGGAQAGVLAPAPGEEERIAVEAQGNVQYANQRGKGVVPAAPGAAKWSVEWTAPEARGPVVFHVSANAADGDETAEGDYIHTGMMTTTARRAGEP